MTDAALISQLEQALLSAENRLKEQEDYIERAKYICANAGIISDSEIVECIKILRKNREGLIQIPVSLANLATIHSPMVMEQALLKRLEIIIFKNTPER